MECCGCSTRTGKSFCPTPEDAETDGAPTTAGKDNTKAPVAERNYWVRWKRQIMDQFQVKIQNVHVCLENMERNSRVGLMFDSLGINSINSIGVSGPDVPDGTPVPARQHVEVTSCKIYVCVTALPELFQMPDDEHFVMRGAWPSCYATRVAGRRFIDWQGLEIEIEMQEKLEIMWRREQLTCCLHLFHEFLERSCGKDDEFFDCEGSDLPDLPKKPLSWSGWLKVKWAGNTEDLGSELPAGVSTEEKTQLLDDLKDESFTEVTSCFQISVLLPKVSMLAIDSSLHFLWGSKLALQVHDLERWNVDVKILDFEICEEMDVKIGAQ